MLKSKGISKNQNYSDYFQNWEIAIAKKMVRKFKSQWKCLEREDFDDLLQECLIKWHEVRGKYDGSKGASPKTFMSTVLEHKLMDLVRDRDTDKRKINIEASSLNQPIKVEEGSRELIEIIDKDGFLEKDFDTHELIELNFQINQVYKELDSKQIQICEYSKQGFSKVEIAEILKIPRTTLHDEYKRIEKIFMRNGLMSYLK